MSLDISELGPGQLAIVNEYDGEPLDMAVEIGRLRGLLRRARRHIELLESQPGDIVGEVEILRDFTVKGYEVPTMNKIYSQKHWTQRKRIADEVHSYVKIFGGDVEPVEERVNIDIIAHRRRAIDPDNVPAKLIVDGLRHAGIIPDDTNKYVRAVTVVCQQSSDPAVDVILWRYNREGNRLSGNADSGEGAK